MTEILRAFWKEKRPERIAVLVSGILFAVIFWIYEIPVEIAGYAFLLVILWNVIWFTLVFIRYEKRQRILEENQGKIRTEAGGFPEAESRESEMYQELIRQLYEEKKELESSVQIEKQELSDYYSMWVHQIKTPIAALGVLIQNGFCNLRLRLPDLQPGRNRPQGSPQIFPDVHHDQNKTSP